MHNFEKGSHAAVNMVPTVAKVRFIQCEASLRVIEFAYITQAPLHTNQPRISPQLE